jgi:hypothetical protein
MATILTDSQTQTAVGEYAPATMVKFPEFGATFSVGLTAGTATIELRAWVNPSYKQVLATFNLDVEAEASGAVPVSSVWTDWDWNVTSVTGSPTISLDAIGRGV